MCKPNSSLACSAPIRNDKHLRSFTLTTQRIEGLPCTQPLHASQKKYLLEMSAGIGGYSDDLPIALSFAFAYHDLNLSNRLVRLIDPLALVT
jgi:hypothetical protein